MEILSMQDDMKRGALRPPTRGSRVRSSGDGVSAAASPWSPGRGGLQGLWDTRAMRVCIVGMLGACLVGLPLLGPSIRRPAVMQPCPALARSARLAYSPSMAARRAATQCWVRAQIRVNREREAVEAWDPRAAEQLNPEAWRLQ